MRNISIIKETKDISEMQFNWHVTNNWQHQQGRHQHQ